MAREMMSAAAVVADVSPRQAWECLKNEPLSELVDVRTQPEWVFSGIPDLSSLNRRLHMVSWKLYPSFSQNGNFLEELRASLGTDSSPTRLYFICKTGGRSLDAAIEVLAQTNGLECYNIVDGFEGPQNESGRRGVLQGWKASGLPWIQS